MSNMKAFIHGNVNFSGPALLGSANMASEMFLATTSTVTHNVGFNSGVLCNNGMFGLNVGCNVNGTSRSNQSAIILGRGSLSGIDSGGFYASGTTHTANNSNVSHLIQERASSSHRPQKSGCYTAMTGGITRDFGNALTPITTYLRDAAPFSTAFSDFVPGVTVDETLGGGVYTRDNSVWATPWLFEDHLDHPAMLKGLAHYLVVESGDPINDILGEVSVISDTYPLFLEIEYSENDDGSDRFTYKVLDTTYTENTEAVVLVTYPFDVQPTTQIWNNGEEITSFNNRSYQYRGFMDRGVRRYVVPTYVEGGGDQHGESPDICHPKHQRVRKESVSEHAVHLFFVHRFGSGSNPAVHGVRHDSRVQCFQLRRTAQFYRSCPSLSKICSHRVLDSEWNLPGGRWDPRSYTGEAPWPWQIRMRFLPLSIPLIWDNSSRSHPKIPLLFVLIMTKHPTSSILGEKRSVLVILLYSTGRRFVFLSFKF